MFKKVKDMTKEECLKEIGAWSNILCITWALCLITFIGLGVLIIKNNIPLLGPASLLLALPLIFIFGTIYPMDIINDILKREGLIKEE